MLIWCCRWLPSLFMPLYLRLSCRALLAYALFCALPAAHAQGLEETLQAAYAFDKQIQTAELQVAIAEESVVQSRSSLRPRLSMSGSLRRSWFGSDANFSGLQYTQSGSASLSLSQSLYQGGRLRVGISNAEISVENARISLLRAEQNTLQRAARSFIDVLNSRIALRLLDRQEAFITDLKQKTAAGGYPAIADTSVVLAKIESELSSLSSQRVTLDQATRRAESEYKNMTGTTPPASFILKRHNMMQTLREEELMTRAKAHNPSVLSATLSHAQAKNSVMLAKATRLPTLSMSGSLSTSRSYSSGSDSLSAGAGVSVSVPLYQGGGTASRIRAARLREQLSEQRLQQTIENVENTARNAWINLDAAEKRVPALSKQLQTLVKEKNDMQQREGMTESQLLDMMETNNRVFSTAVELLAARKNVFNARFAALATIGSLTLEYMQQQSNLSEPASKADS